MIFKLIGERWHCGLDVFFSIGDRSDAYRSREIPDRTALPQQDPPDFVIENPAACRHLDLCP